MVHFSVDNRSAGRAKATGGTQPTPAHTPFGRCVDSFVMHWLAISQCWQARCSDNLHIDTVRQARLLRFGPVRYGAFFFAGPARSKDAAGKPANPVADAIAQGDLRRCDRDFLKVRTRLPIIVKFINRQHQRNHFVRGSSDMLKSIGKPSLLLKLGSRRCICMPNRLMDDTLRTRIRPLVFGGYAWWWDKA